MSNANDLPLIRVLLDPTLLLCEAEAVVVRDEPLNLERLLEPKPRVRFRPLTKARDVLVNARLVK